jgi:2-methylcitrate dehydratase PrpD
MTGRLIGMTADQITMAQGITSSTASGSSREYSAETAWNKRVHPGWAAVSGITAAMLARQGFTGPTRVYEGKYGLFPSHAADRIGRCDYSLATQDLGAKWEIERVAVKPVPVGQLGIALVDAAVALSREHRIAPADVASMLVLIPKEAVPIMWEPIAKRRRPANGYAAQFSIPYTVAASFARGRFSLAELSASSIADPEILALADRIEYAIDPDSPYPKYYSGELIVTTRDGRKLRHREHVNRGAEDRPVSNEDIVEKFMGNMQTVASTAHAERIRKLILGLDADIAAGEVGRALAQPH